MRVQQGCKYATLEAPRTSYRNPDVTNAYVQAYYGMYNYAVLGLK